jgi:hypothetical protein
MSSMPVLGINHGPAWPCMALHGLAKGIDSPAASTADTANTPLLPIFTIYRPVGNIVQVAIRSGMAGGGGDLETAAVDSNVFRYLISIPACNRITIKVFFYSQQYLYTSIRYTIHNTDERSCCSDIQTRADANVVNGL